MTGFRAISIRIELNAPLGYSDGRKAGDRSSIRVADVAWLIAAPLRNMAGLHFHFSDFGI
jgi:hypothetical protein